MYRHRYVAILEIDNVFLNAKNDKYVLILIHGKLAELLFKVDQKLYRKYVIASKHGMPMLYVKLIKALYVMLRSSMIFNNKLRSHLEEIGFEINPYDPCVKNMTINSSQMTVCWHVDDLKVSHKEESAVYVFVLNIFKMLVHLKIPKHHQLSN